MALSTDDLISAAEVFEEAPDNDLVAAAAEKPMAPAPRMARFR